ncbi:hypothetical protein [uncultured Nocardioides sp.]|uniref:hypothetical protein n=1 Tax=uncultured Nocardioides sp. TaxID=198441 RepID=UPI00261047CC|nr:hypothetical protein [uncultured Nocardioides sp.]
MPITYSIDAGLESLLHRYKDFPGYRWLRWPLGALLYEFISAHGPCIDAQTPQGRIDVAVTMPANTARTFDPLSNLLTGVVEGDEVLDVWTWGFQCLRRNAECSRPARRELKPAAYLVEPFAVEGSSVLLVDDTWTSGSSAASASMALKRAGAQHVTVLTLGRQLNLRTAYGSTADIFDEASRDWWDLADCVLCA